MADNADNHDLRERPISELLKQLSQETATLVRQELELAKAEMAQKGKRAGTGAGDVRRCRRRRLAGADLVDAVPDRRARHRHAVLAGGADPGDRVDRRRRRAGASGQGEGSRGHSRPVPEQTVETVKEDVQWAKTQR